MLGVGLCSLRNMSPTAVTRELFPLALTSMDDMDQSDRNTDNSKCGCTGTRITGNDSSITTSEEEAETIPSNKKKTVQCRGFPSWPLSEADKLFNGTIGAPQCFRQSQNKNKNTRHCWVLHQSSVPDRRPSRTEVGNTLRNLPEGTAYEWHSDDSICAFMRTQPLRFQALFNTLARTPHQVDLWRYLLLYQQGGIYLDDDAELLVPFNTSFVNSVDSIYVTQGNSVKSMFNNISTNATMEQRRPFGITIYNGLLITKPCNHVLLSVAEHMVQLGPNTKDWESTVPQPSALNWYNLKLLAMAIAERAPRELQPNPQCRGVHPQECQLFQNQNSTSYDQQQHMSTFQERPLPLYQDDHGWKTAVFDLPKSVRPVTQVAGGKHDSVSVDPHPSPWAPACSSSAVL